MELSLIVKEKNSGSNQDNINIGELLAKEQVEGQWMENCFEGTSKLRICLKDNRIPVES